MRIKIRAQKINKLHFRVFGLCAICTVFYYRKIALFNSQPRLIINEKNRKKVRTVRSHIHTYSFTVTFMLTWTRTHTFLQVKAKCIKLRNKYSHSHKRIKTKHALTKREDKVKWFESKHTNTESKHTSSLSQNGITQITNKKRWKIIVIKTNKSKYRTEIRWNLLLKKTNTRKTKIFIGKS